MDVAAGGFLADAHDPTDVPVQGDPRRRRTVADRCLWGRSSRAAHRSSSRGAGGETSIRGASGSGRSTAGPAPVMVDDHAVGDGEEPRTEVVPCGRGSAVAPQGGTDRVLEAVRHVGQADRGPEVPEQRGPRAGRAVPGRAGSQWSDRPRARVRDIGPHPVCARTAPRGRAEARPRLERGLDQPFAAFLSFEPAVIFAPVPAGMSISSPVAGLRPLRALRCVCSIDRNPGIVSLASELWTTLTASSSGHRAPCRHRPCSRQSRMRSHRSARTWSCCSS